MFGIQRRIGLRSPTSPTGIRELERASGLQIADQVLDDIETKVESP
jgi:hypothetical protein